MHRSAGLLRVGKRCPVRRSRRTAAEQTKDRKAVVLGAYVGCDPGEYRLTPTGSQFNQETSGKLEELMKSTVIKRGQAQVFTNISSEFYGVAVGGLGSEEANYNTLENLNVFSEDVRIASGAGAAALQDRGMYNIYVEGFQCAEAAAEGALLATWKYQEFKHSDEVTPTPKIELFNDQDKDGWLRGRLKAECQNLARNLEEAPANYMTPSIFAQSAVEILCPCGVQVDIRDKDWLETKKMNAFLSVAKGSCEAPLLLEVSYCGAPPGEQPVIAVGKGITFDSGGLCLKSCKGMDKYRADMAGAAVVISIIRCAAAMNLPINIIGLIPLCENMPGGLSLKPGDVLLGLNGKTIRVEDTDNEGRVVMVDPCTYSFKYKPCLILTVASLTKSIRKALGASATGVFSTSEAAWKEMSKAGAETGDRVWRFPLWRHFTQKVTRYLDVDVHNTGNGSEGNPCLGAAFLLEFIPAGVNFVHMDITGTGMEHSGVGIPYLRKGLMTGRPTRTLVQFLYQMSCPQEKSA